MKRDRQDKNVQCLENQFRETLQLPVDMWFGKEITFAVAVSKMVTMFDNINNAMRKEDYRDIKMVTDISGGFDLEVVGSLALRGFSPHSLTVHDKMIKAMMKHITLDLPLRSQYRAMLRFESQKEEKIFLKQLALFGHSIPNFNYSGDDSTQRSKEETYCCTVNYIFVPLASCYFEDHHLKLFDDRLSELDQIMTKKTKIVLDELFKKFGSHLFRGPFHFGGIYMWKCYTAGFAETERQAIHNLHDDVIKAQMRMSLDQCSKITRVSNMNISCAGDYPDELKALTFTQVIMVGGPEKVIGFPDWKYGLLRSNSTWKLIDCGTSQVPIWDIILLNHQEDFKNAAGIAEILRQHWQELNCKIETFIDDIQAFVQSCSKIMKPQFCNILKQLLVKRRDIESQLLNPYAWPSHFLTAPHLKDLLCCIVRTCDVKEIGNINGLLQELIEPTDLETPNVFSCLVTERVYKTDKLPIPILKGHFIGIQRYFKCTYEPLSLVSPSNEAINQYYLLKATSVVEKSVQMLQRHLVLTGQQYEECLLLTLLHPLQYIPEKGRFSGLLTKMDVKYLYENFVSLSEEFFSLLDQSHYSLLSVQSYLFYLTIHVSELMVKSDKCTLSHIKYLMKRIKVKPEIMGLLEFYSNDLTSLRNQMSNIFKEKRDKENSQQDTSRTKARSYMTSKQTSSIIKDTRQGRVLERLGLLKNFYKKLSVQDALLIRDDTIVLPQSGKSKNDDTLVLPQSEKSKNDDTLVLPQSEKSKNDDTLVLPQSEKSKNESKQERAPHAFVILQKILSFHHSCRMVYHDSIADSRESDSEESSDESDDTIHPLDCLLALLHCSDNFLRQDLFCRLASCQIALPLLLPDLMTNKPTILLWAMRSIVKEFKLPDQTTYTHQLITYPAPFVSFLRIGRGHSMSKSETLNGVINNPMSDINNRTFVSHNYIGGAKKRILVDGLLEISWYLPGDDLFDRAIAFTNLRGDAIDRSHKKQIDFLCEISTMHVVFINDGTLKEDSPRHDAIQLLNRLSRAPGGVVLVQTTQGKVKDLIAQCFDSDHIKKHFKNIKYHTSSTVVCENIQRKIKSILHAPSLAPFSSLEDAAHKHNIPIDEHDADCIRGKELANKLYTLIEKHQKVSTLTRKSPKDLLPLQSEELWHRWAVLEKELYRQKSQHHTHRDEIVCDEDDQATLSIQEYGSKQRKKLKEIRSKQYPLATTKLNKFMATFVKNLRTLKGHALWYYIKWIKFKLDDDCEEILPPLIAEKRKKKTDLSAFQKQKYKSREAECRKELQALDRKIVDASFGLEHMLREVSQIYEAVVDQEDILGNCESPVEMLPQIVAQLLSDGFPIELLDGDASHMPQKWISAVLNSLSNILQHKLSCKPKMYVVSILGVQSTGKSTLMNTLFGVQFTVSAGRCTRGAFMQLIPVHQSLHERLGVHYFLLIDTEGLQAPELDRLNAHEHDNELATFVIGASNLTLINVNGEVTCNMDDILHTAVHAFLRMHQVSLKPSCHIVHHHVAAVGADEKIKMGQLKTKDNLDKMTQAAAKDTGLETQYTQFSDVIKFDYENDVFYFPDLLNGKPPMDRVSSGYSEAAQRLKVAIISSCTNDAKYQSHFIVDIKTHLERLWKAILQEDFVFSFRNTFEVIAFKTLDGKYSDWSWAFKNEMTQWERAAENMLYGCIADQLETIYQERLQSLDKCTNEKLMKYEQMMKRFFDEDNKIILKWKQDTEARLRYLSEDLKYHAKKHCMQLYESRRGRVDAENKKEELNVRILKHVQGLVSDLDKQKIDEDEVIQKFEEKWNQWIHDLTPTIKRLENPNVPHEVENGVVDFLKHQNRHVQERLGDPQSSKFKPLEKWGSCLHLRIMDCHIQLIAPTSSYGLNLFWEKRKRSNYSSIAQKHTEKTLRSVNTYLENLEHSEENFNPYFVTDLLRTMQSNIKVDSEEFQFTDEYEVEMGLTACGYAIPVFENMAKAFIIKHDPIHYIQFVMKPHFKNVFLSIYRETDKEKIAAQTVCQELEEPIMKCVLTSLNILIVEEMKEECPWIKTKPSFVAKVLLEIGQRLSHDKENFKPFVDFLTDVKYSLQYWAKYFTEVHCDFGSPSRLSNIAVQKLSDTIKFIKTQVKLVTQSHSKQHVHEWLRQFHVKVGEKINFSLGNVCTLVGDQVFPHADFFSCEVLKGLRELDGKLKQTFSELKYSSTTKQLGAHEIILERIAGCTAQCPFCKAQCELTNADHPTHSKCHINKPKINHSTQHHPQCLGRYRWTKDNTMVLDICTQSVASDTKFMNKDTKGKYHPYKKFIQLYPDWNIPADKSLESSLFWKWFIGHYSTDIEESFGYATTVIPGEWKEIKWREVAAWLKEEYKI